MPTGHLTEEQRARSTEASRAQERTKHVWKTKGTFVDIPEDDIPWCNDEDTYFRNTMHGKMDDINDFEYILRRL